MNLNPNDLLDDDEVEAICLQILKFFHDDPLTPDELTEQLYKAAQWATESRLNSGLLKLVIRGEISMGYNRETGELSFKKLPPEVQTAKARILEEDEEEDDPADWWKTGS